LTFYLAGAVGVSPIAATGLTGFSLTVDSTGQFSTSGQVTGHLFAASYSAPTPATLTAAIGDMGTAFTDANGRVNPTFNNLASGELTQCRILLCSLTDRSGAIGNLVLPPGLYKWSSGITIGSDVTIAGAATDSETSF
jgi:hypothetical protein